MIYIISTLILIGIIFIFCKLCKNKKQPAQPQWYEIREKEVIEKNSGLVSSVLNILKGIPYTEWEEIKSEYGRADLKLKYKDQVVLLSPKTSVHDKGRGKYHVWLIINDTHILTDKADKLKEIYENYYDDRIKKNTEKWYSENTTQLENIINKS